MKGTKKGRTNEPRVFFMRGAARRTKSVDGSCPWPRPAHSEAWISKKNFQQDIMSAQAGTRAFDWFAVRWRHRQHSPHQRRSLQWSPFGSGSGTRKFCTFVGFGECTKGRWDWPAQACGFDTFNQNQSLQFRGFDRFIKVAGLLALSEFWDSASRVSQSHVLVSPPQHLVSPW